MNQPVAEQNTGLATPVERPNADVLIYDGHCRFCLANVKRLSHLDRGRIAYLSLHDEEVSRRWPMLTFEQLMDQMHLIERNGDQHRGATALRYLSRKLPGLWWLAPLLHVPGSLPFWQFAYRCVAKIRYRLAGKTCEGSCSLHIQ